MSVIGDAYVRIRPETTGFQAETETGVLDSVTGIAKKAAAIMGGIFAVKEGVDFLKSSYEAATESNKVVAQTGAVIKSTGDASKVTAAQVDDLGKAIAAKTGIDHDQIQTAENLILTFTNVRNEAGKGNDIFNQTTKIATDMGAALGGDASSNAIRLGRALQDPTAGLTALTRVGVTFTQAQKDQIKQMQSSGDLMGAQKVILGELNKEFGGSAEAQATSAGKLKESWKEIQEQLGQKLVPVVEKVADLLSQYLPVAMDLAGKAFGAVGKVIGQLAPYFDRLKFGVSILIDAFKDPNTPWASDSPFLRGMHAIGVALADAAGYFTKMQAAIGPVTDWLKANMAPVLGAVGALVAAVVVPAFIAWAAAAAEAAVSMIVAAAPVIALAAVIGGLGYAVVYAYQHFATFRTIVDEIAHAIVPMLEGAFELVKAIITDAVTIILDLWGRFGDQLLGHLETALHAVATMIQGALDVITGIVDLFKAILTGKWGDAWKALIQIFTGVWLIIKGYIEVAINEISTIIGAAMALISAAWGLIWHSLATLFTSMWAEVWGAIKGAWDAVVDFFTTAAPAAIGSAWSTLWNGVGALVGGLWDGITGAVTGMWQGIVDFFTHTAPAAIGTAWSAIWNGLTGAVAGLWSGVTSAVTGAWGSVVGFFTHDAPAAIVNAAKGLWGGLEDEFTSVINTIIDLFNQFTSHIPSIHLPGTNITVEAPTMGHIGHAAGGFQASGSFFAGEAGTEFVSLRPGGAMVYPAGSPESRGGAGGMPPVSISIEANFGAGTNANDVLAAMRSVAQNEMATTLRSVLASASAGRRR